MTSPHNQDPPMVEMMHMLCNHCGMSGTIVVTPIGLEAWGDHMETHGDEASYRSWVWQAMTIDFDDRGDQEVAPQLDV